MNILTGKKILLICPLFYNYADLIINCLVDLGMEVTFYENKMFSTDLKCSTDKLGTIIRKVIKKNEKKIYQNKIIKECQNQNFDFLLSINGFSISKEIIQCVKKNNPKVKTILFLWDSLTYWKYSNILSWFDTVYSFDHNDCKKYNLKYHPDFILGLNESYEDEKKYDVVHIGSVSVFSSHRIPILAKIKKYCIENNISHYITIVSNITNEWRDNKLSMIYKLFSSHKYRLLLWRYYKYRNDGLYSNNKLPLREVERIEHNSNLIIDIPPVHQSGCTIRSLEALNRGNKLLTTNKSIIEDEFYDENMIYFFNYKKINIINILGYPNRRINLDKLKLKNWCKSILSE